MSFLNWLKRTIGRAAEGNRTHLIGSAELFAVDPEVLDRMKASSDEESERLLIESLEGQHAAVVDWKASLSDVLEELTCLTDQERAVLVSAPAPLTDKRIYSVSHQITDLLHPPLRALRIVETFGDAYIVFLVPPQLIEAFDDTNRHWTI
ncbi:hypothetical protein [Nitrogeniibacter aestuarii]|uniref:hypothetical protein n=1 Tax=Nitrogeniibacter aestuarii TaxID=2815343 RepID=UPI001E61CB50|nr:hypothetical protein [Nitrogeniibacter aestuarii]